MLAHTFNPKTQEAEPSNLCDFEASLVYRVSSRLVRSVLQRNSVQKTKTKTKNREKKSILYLLYFQGGNGRKWENYQKSVETITQI